MGRVIALSLLALTVLFAFTLVRQSDPARVAERILLADLNAEEGLAYRDANRRRPQVASLPSGLQIEMIQTGDGPLPEPADWVRVHYRGSHLDGRVFDDSWAADAPATLAIARAIPGWREALIQLPVGSRALLTLPPELAYGRAGGGPIGPEETLVFDLELLAIVAPPRSPALDPALDPAQHAVPGLR